MFLFCDELKNPYVSAAPKNLKFAGVNFSDPADDTGKGLTISICSCIYWHNTTIVSV
jgi:hypothetical protein